MLNLRLIELEMWHDLGMNALCPSFTSVSLSSRFMPKLELMHNLNVFTSGTSWLLTDYILLLNFSLRIN